jgi:hypothetical protein
MGQIVPIERNLMTPFGEAEADFMWVPDSPDFPSEYQCWILETNEVWWFPQPLVRAVKSMSSHRRGLSSAIVMPDALLKQYAPHLLRHKESPFHEQAKKLLKA